MYVPIALLPKLSRKNIKKFIDNKALEKSDKCYMDLCQVRVPSLGCSKFWCLIEDEYTGILWSPFLKRKSQVAEYVIDLFKKIYHKTKVMFKVLRCDSSKENKKLQDRLEQDDVIFTQVEFTAPYTPQQNGVVERKFATLYSKIRAMLIRARLPDDLRTKLWAEYAATATFVENLIFCDDKSEPPYKLFYGSIPNRVKKLRVFGEINIVANQTSKGTKTKLDNCGYPCIFVGYPPNLPPDVYKMFNPRTKVFACTRNIIWLHKFYNKVNFLDYKNNSEVFYDKIMVRHGNLQISDKNHDITMNDDGSDSLVEEVKDIDPINLQAANAVNIVESQDQEGTNDLNTFDIEDDTKEEVAQLEDNDQESPNNVQDPSESQVLNQECIAKKSGIDSNQTKQSEIDKKIKLEQELQKLDTSYNRTLTNLSYAQEKMFHMNHLTDTGEPSTY